MGHKWAEKHGKCKRGHEFTPENTRVHTRTGHRICKACVNLLAKRAHKRPATRKKLAAAMAKWRAIPENKEHERRIAAVGRRERYEWLNSYKAERGCCSCPERHPACLDLHHRDGSQKEATISLVIWRWKLERVQAEVDKCDVMCANCHRKHHWNERRKQEEVNGGISSEDGQRRQPDRGTARRDV